MKNKTVLLLCFLLSAASFTGTFTGFVSGSREIKRQAIQNAKAAETKTKGQIEIKTSYMVKDKEGHIALYKVTGEKAELYEEYETEVSSLPEGDREELKKGIKDLSFDEALQIIEDFSS